MLAGAGNGEVNAAFDAVVKSSLENKDSDKLGDNSSNNNTNEKKRKRRGKKPTFKEQKMKALKRVQDNPALHSGGTGTRLPQKSWPGSGHRRDLVHHRRLPSNSPRLQTHFQAHGADTHV